MILNYFILFFNLFVSFSLFTLPKFLKSRLLFHYQYLQFIFAGLFINLLIKIVIAAYYDIELTGHHNIILLLLSLCFSSIINIYFYIVEVIGHFIKYCCNYIINGEFDILQIYADESHLVHVSYNNKHVDRFYLSKPFFQFFILLRYFIIREPYLYLFFHIVIMINFLYDKHILYTYFYLLVLHLSRFIFFLGEEKFKIKEYMDHWQHAILFLYSNLPRMYYVIDPKYMNSKDLVYKLTINNLNFAYFFNSRYYLEDMLYIYFRSAYKTLKIEPWRYTFHMKRSIETFTARELENILELYTNLINDTQKFVRTNSYFWLIIFLFMIYLDFYFTNLFLQFSH